MKQLFPVILVFITCLGCKQQDYPTIVTGKTEIASGPMVGYSTMQEVAIWVQAKQKSTVFLNYAKAPIDSTQLHMERGISRETNPTNANVVKFILTDLEPGQTYQYVVSTPDEERFGTFQTQPLWQWRTDPPDFSFAAGSCVYVNEGEFDRPGTPYGGNYEIFKSIHDKNPDFMVWLGDNTYLREADWNSMSGILARYSHSRAVPEMQPLLANAHHYAIWDDHDYGPNDSDRSYHLKDSTLKAFNLFWANPSAGINGKPGITTKFQWNDCEFFLLDDRYYRTPNGRKTGERFIWGEEQVQWLIDNLSGSRASFKFVAVGGQFLNTAAKFENHANFAEERQQIIDLIHAENIKNVIFLTGDRHHTEFSKLESVGKPTIYDLTISPLTSGTHKPRNEGNTLQIPSSFIHEKNFATINVSGPLRARTAAVLVFDKDGKQIFEYSIQQED